MVMLLGQNHAIREYKLNIPYRFCDGCKAQTDVKNLKFFGNINHPESCAKLCWICALSKGWC